MIRRFDLDGDGIPHEPQAPHRREERLQASWWAADAVGGGRVA